MYATEFSMYNMVNIIAKLIIDCARSITEDFQLLLCGIKDLCSILRVEARPFCTACNFPGPVLYRRFSSLYSLNTRIQYLHVFLISVWDRIYSPRRFYHPAAAFRSTCHAILSPRDKFAETPLNGETRYSQFRPNRRQNRKAELLCSFLSRCRSIFGLCLTSSRLVHSLVLNSIPFVCLSFATFNELE